MILKKKVMIIEGMRAPKSRQGKGIWFAQVVNSLILKVKDISKFAKKISKKFLKLDKSAKSVLCI